MALLKRKRSGLGDAMEVVTRFVNACNRHDADGVYACLHPDFDSIQPMYPTRNFRGADQVRRNWQAIFDAEPGFRLTVLRSAAVDDTIWLELHGAGEDAEVAGVFVMGIQGDRIRWARIYSALVEPVPEGVGEPPAPLREVPRHDQPVAAGDGEVVEEALIAPVLDMDRGGRRRRRRRGDDDGTEAETGDEADEDAGDATAVISGDADMATTVVIEGDDQASVVVDGADEVALVVEGDDDVAVAVDAGESEPEVLVAAPPDDDGGPATEAVDMVTITTDDPEPTVDPGDDDDPDSPRRGIFGRKRP
jgi:ketosteroid isomerase-like protein